MPWTNDGWEEPNQDDPAWAESVRSMWGGDFGENIVRRRRVREGGPPRAGRDTPIHRPHYSDERFARGREHTLYGATRKGLAYEYSDRLWQWDYTKAQQAGGEADKSGHVHGSPAWWEAWLSYYHGKPVALHHIIGGVNVSNGYEYYVFGYTADARG